jgi:hypothetical protein
MKDLFTVCVSFQARRKGAGNFRPLTSGLFDRRAADEPRANRANKGK